MFNSEDKPLISVILPVYNAETYLKQCIESVLSQDYENIELLVVDDGSKDKSGQILDEMALNDHRLKVMHQKNQGAGSALNEGLNRMKGKYVFFIDDDDWIEKNCLSFLYQKIITSDFDFVSCTDTVHFEDGKQSIKNHVKDIVCTPSQAIHDLLSDHKYVSEAMMEKLYKRELFDGLRLQKGRNYQDTAVFIRLMTRCHKLGYYNVSLYNYRVHSGSITHSGYTTNSVQQVQMYTEQRHLIEKYFPESLNLLDHYIVSVSMSNYMKLVIEEKEKEYPEDIEFYFENFQKYKPVFEWNTSKAGLYAEWILARISPRLLHHLIWNNRKKLAPIVNAVIKK